MRTTASPPSTQHYGSAIDGTDPSRLFLILANDIPVGFCETYLHADNPEWDRTIALPDVAGIDYLIGAPELCGHGLGTAVISSFCDVVFDLYPQISGIASVPQAANAPSRRVLEKNGFRLVDVRLVESDDPGDSGLPRSTAWSGRARPGRPKPDRVALVSTRGLVTCEDPRSRLLGWLG